MKKTIVAITLAAGLGGAAFTAIAQDESAEKDNPGMPGGGSMMQGGMMMQGDMMKMMSEMGPMMENCNRMMSTMLERMDEDAAEKSPSNG